VTPPFFIVGFQRSGTTLLRMMLDNHPQVAIPLDTTGLWARNEARLAEFGNLDAPDGATALIEALLAEERIRLWEIPFSVESVLKERSLPGYPGIIDAFYRAYARAKGKEIWGDKDPGNMLRIPGLLRWFPNARILHIIRDGRDACLSQLKQDFGFNDCLPCAEAWREQVWWVRQLGELLGPEQYLEVRYEDLVADPEAQLQRICRFLQLDYSKEMLLYHENVTRSIPESKRHIWPLIDKPPVADNVFGWKKSMSASLRIAFEKRAAQVLRDTGYETLPGPIRGGRMAELASLLTRIRQSLRRPRSLERP
jgi:sulfotransferase family protein